MSRITIAHANPNSSNPIAFDVRRGASDGAVIDTIVLPQGKSVVVEIGGLVLTEVSVAELNRRAAVNEEVEKQRLAKAQEEANARAEEQRKIAAAQAEEISKQASEKIAADGGTPGPSAAEREAKLQAARDEVARKQALAEQPSGSQAARPVLPSPIA